MIKIYCKTKNRWAVVLLRSMNQIYVNIEKIYQSKHINNSPANLPVKEPNYSLSLLKNSLTSVEHSSASTPCVTFVFG